VGQQRGCVVPLLSVVWQHVLALLSSCHSPPPPPPIWWGPLWVKTGDPIETREERNPLIGIAPTEPTFVNVYGVQESIPPAYVAWRKDSILGPLKLYKFGD
jgi:hypothetical protein